MERIYYFFNLWQNLKQECVTRPIWPRSGQNEFLVESAVFVSILHACSEIAAQGVRCRTHHYRKRQAMAIKRCLIPRTGKHWDSKADRFAVSLNVTLSKVLESVQSALCPDQLGVVLSAELDKLNVYTEGGFFKPHQVIHRWEVHIDKILVSNGIHLRDIASFDTEVTWNADDTANLTLKQCRLANFMAWRFVSFVFGLDMSPPKRDAGKQPEETRKVLEWGLYFWW